MHIIGVSKSSRVLTLQERCLAGIGFRRIVLRLMKKKRLIFELPANWWRLEWDFAKSLKATYESYGLPTASAKYNEEAKALVEELSDGGKKALNDFIAPLFSGDFFEPGSTDVGDVSWQTPTAQINTVCFASGSPGHSWQNVSMGKSSIGHKGLISAGKIIAATAIELFEAPEILAEARAEFAKATKEGYTCPIPKNEFAKPVEI